MAVREEITQSASGEFVVGGEGLTNKVQLNSEEGKQEAIVEEDEESSPSSPSSSELASSGEENEYGSQGESEGESSDTDLEVQGKWLVQGVKEVKD